MKGPSCHIGARASVGIFIMHLAKSMGNIKRVPSWSTTVTTDLQIWSLHDPIKIKSELPQAARTMQSQPKSCGLRRAPLSGNQSYYIINPTQNTNMTPNMKIQSLRKTTKLVLQQKIRKGFQLMFYTELKQTPTKKPKHLLSMPTNCQ